MKVRQDPPARKGYYGKQGGERFRIILKYCWDNPIAAGAHCIYTQRDIQDCLNRYARDEEITDVWVWAEQTGDQAYELYIGYA